MKRRRVLASAVAGAASLAGCVGITVESDGTPSNGGGPETATGGVRLAADSEYMVAVRRDPALLLPDSLGVDLVADPPTALSAVLLVVDGEQDGQAEVTTGDTKVSFARAFPAHEEFAAGVELLPVRGGDQEGCCGDWVGGEILERVRVVRGDGD